MGIGKANVTTVDLDRIEVWIPALFGRRPRFCGRTLSQVRRDVEDYRQELGEETGILVKHARKRSRPASDSA